MAFKVNELTSGRFNLPSEWSIVKVRDVAKINGSSIQRNYNHEWI